MESKASVLFVSRAAPRFFGRAVVLRAEELGPSDGDIRDLPSGQDGHGRSMRGLCAIQQNNFHRIRAGVGIRGTLARADDRRTRYRTRYPMAAIRRISSVESPTCAMSNTEAPVIVSKRLLRMEIRVEKNCTFSEEVRQFIYFTNIH